MQQTLAYKIILEKDEHARVATLQEMTADEIQALIRALEEEMREREWDRRWDETLASPESQAFLAELTAATEAKIAAGQVREWSFEDE